MVGVLIRLHKLELHIRLESSLDIVAGEKFVALEKLKTAQYSGA
jgi:hypothetical protein